MLHVPMGENGRAGHGAELFTATSAEVFDEPAVVLSAEAARRK